jgi:hypothetical protein
MSRLRLFQIRLAASAALLTVVFTLVHLLWYPGAYFTISGVSRQLWVALGEVSGSDVPEALLGRQADQQQRLIYAELPEDPERVSALIEETVLQGMADIDRRPEFWKPYSDGVATVKAAARPLEALLGRNDRRSDAVNKWLEKSGGSAQDYIVLPLRGRADDAIIILSADSGYPVGTLAVDPW